MTVTGSDTSPEDVPARRPRKKRMRKVGDAAFRRVRNLPNFGEVHNRLCAGVSCESIARWLQDDLGFCADVAFSGLVRQLYRYRNAIPPEERRTRTQAVLHEKVKEQTHRVNVLEEANKLYEYQLQRLDKVIALEDRAQMPVDALGRELDRAGRMLDRITGLKERLGLIKKGSPELSSDVAGAAAVGAAAGVVAAVAQKYGDDAPDVLTKFGKKVMDALQRVHTANATQARSAVPLPAGSHNPAAEGPLDPRNEILRIPVTGLRAPESP